MATQVLPSPAKPPAPTQNFALRASKGWMGRAHKIPPHPTRCTTANYVGRQGMYSPTSIAGRAVGCCGDYAAFDARKNLKEKYIKGNGNSPASPLR